MYGTLGFGLILGSLIMNPVDGRGQLALMVCDKTQASSAALESAQQTTEQIFRNSRIGVQWTNLPPATCTQPPMAAGITIVIAPESPKGWTSADAMGFAPGGTGDRPRAYIFMNLVNTFMNKFQIPVDRENALGTILGYAIAHEVGHVLLPGEPHTKTGIMSTDWSFAQWENALAGTLWFAPQHQEIMIKRLGTK